MRRVLLLLVIAGCSKKASDGGGGGGEAKKSEAQLYLQRIEKAAKAYAVENAGFPTGTTGMTPSTPCCEAPDKKCAADPAIWSGDPVWSALDFSIDEASVFQYSYSAEKGDQFMAIALGDPGCTGKEQTFTLKGELKDGSPVFEYYK